MHNVVIAGILRIKMKNYIGLLVCDAKDFLSDATNRVFIAVIVLFLAVCYCQVRTEKAIKRVYNYDVKAKKELLTEIKTNRDKIHFRYFNLTNSLEDIHNVKIDTLNGRIEK